MRVAIVGAGALGSVYGARLARFAGCEVSVVARAPAPASEVRLERVEDGEVLRWQVPARVTAAPRRRRRRARLRALRAARARCPRASRRRSAPVVVMTPMMPQDHAMLAAALPGRLRTGMPSVVSYQNDAKRHPLLAPARGDDVRRAVALGAVRRGGRAREAPRRAPRSARSSRRTSSSATSRRPSRSSRSRWRSTLAGSIDVVLEHDRAPRPRPRTRPTRGASSDAPSARPRRGRRRCFGSSGPSRSRSASASPGRARRRPSPTSSSTSGGSSTRRTSRWPRRSWTSPSRRTPPTWRSTSCWNHCEGLADDSPRPFIVRGRRRAGHRGKLPHGFRRQAVFSLRMRYGGARLT